MKNTKNLCIVVLMILFLISGLNIIPMHLYAVKDNSDSHNQTEDLKKNFSKDSKSKANQHLDQDNLCYISPDCKQANDGQQIEGKGNDATGINDQSTLAFDASQGQPGPVGPECPSGYTFNDVTQKCEKPACTGGFTFNAVTQKCEKPRTTQATCPNGSSATGRTCEVTTITYVPATCPANTTGPDTNGRCATAATITALCPTPASGTATPTVSQGQ